MSIFVASLDLDSNLNVAAEARSGGIGRADKCPSRLAAELQNNFRVEDAVACWRAMRSEEHTSELQSLMRISYAVFCLKKKLITQPSTLVNTYCTQIRNNQ